MTQPSKTTTLLKLTVSSLVVSTALVGCKPASLAQRPRSPASTPVSAAEDFTQRLAAKISGQAAQALAMGDHAQAITLAEGLVAAAPEDAGYRTLLAQSYLRAGRFLAADQAFADVIRLMPDNDKARVAQAVSRIARGDREGALAVLADVRNAPADDYGLALALAGEPQRALAVLEPAARGMRGTSRTRQNLALAYALAGQWDKARVVAAQDVSPADVDRRMEDWARLASPDARSTQVASLLGTRPVLSDPGQPQMLALVKPAVAAPVEVAKAEPVPQPVEVTAPPVPVQIAAASSLVTPVAAPVISGSIAIAAPPGPVMAQPVPVARAPSLAAAARSTQVASLLGTRPVLSDPGQPQMLALVKPAVAAPVEVAKAEPVPQPVEVTAPPVPVQIAAASSLVTPVAAPVISGSIAIAAPPGPVMAQPVPVARAPSLAAAAPAPLPVAIAPSVTEAPDSRPLAEKLSSVTRVAFTAARVKLVQPQPQQGDWVVQLGAYKSARRAEAGWLHLSDNFKRLTQYAPAHSLYTVAATGAVYHRLSVAGFATRASASTMCHAIIAHGGSCFVRRELNEAPLQMVSRERQRLAGL